MLKKEKILTLLVSLIALIFTFGIANSSLSYANKILLFTGIISSFFIIQLIFGVFFQKVREIPVKSQIFEKEKNLFNSEIEEKLLILEEANKFFGASLKTDDMFRLVNSRIKQMVEFDTGVLFLLNNQNRLYVKFATGLNSQFFQKVSLNCDEGLAGKAFLSKKVEIDKNLKTEKDLIIKESLKDLNSAIGIPLEFAGEVFAILNLYSKKKEVFDNQTTILMEAVGERVAPLIRSAFNFEKNLANSLVDSLTKLPNERAFYMVLENQIAEAQRFKEQRDLTVLAIDIKDFAELNSRFGHCTGDRILAFASQLIKGQLRGMDFLARSQKDEFFIILPTATRKTAKNIIKRINRVFINNPFDFGEDQKNIIELNFGTAAFYRNGEKSNQLIRAAIIDKRKSKAIGTGSVIKFPKEFLN